MAVAAGWPQSGSSSRPSGPAAQEAAAAPPTPAAAALERSPASGSEYGRTSSSPTRSGEAAAAVPYAGVDDGRDGAVASGSAGSGPARRSAALPASPRPSGGISRPAPPAATPAPNAAADRAASDAASSPPAAIPAAPPPPDAAAAPAPPAAPAHGGGAAQSRGWFRRAPSPSISSSTRYPSRSSGGIGRLMGGSGSTSRVVAAAGRAAAASRLAQSWKVGQTGNAEDRQYASWWASARGA